jgi:hypothetical protein
VTLAAANTGKVFRAYLKSNNEIGSVTSSLMSVVLANVPDKPSAAPSSDALVTNGNQIGLLWTAPVSDGGSEITSYDL